MSFPQTSKKIVFQDGGNLDAFHRVRIGQPVLLSSSVFNQSKNPNFWSEKTAGAGSASINANTNVVEMDVGTASGDSVIRQTKEYYEYQPGQSHFIFVTFTLDSQKENLRQRVGYFDDNNGLFLELNDEDEPAFVIRSSTSGAPVDTRIPQSSWNLDTLDYTLGANPSNETLDLTQRQILVIDFQWLGVGRVRFGFDIGGVIIYVHEALHSNLTGSLPYMKTPKLPIRYEIENTDVTASASQLKQICSACMREGSQASLGVYRAVSAALDASATGTTTLRTVLGVRLKAAKIRDTLRFVETSINHDGADPGTYFVIVNPGGTGAATWSDVPGLGSIAQYSRDQLAVPVDADGLPNDANSVVVEAGTIEGGSFLSSSQAQEIRVQHNIPVVADIDGTPDELWVCWQQSSGSSNMLCTVTYEEIE